MAKKKKLVIKKKKISIPPEKEYRFPKGNQAWQIRSKHGRDKLFVSPELLLEAANEYFEWCVYNPLYKSELVSYKGNNELVDVPVKRVFSREGLNGYLGANSEYLRNFKNYLKNKTDKLSADFYSVIREIEDRIDNQQFEGASSGFFNANIISRKLGLVDKIANEHSGEVKLPVININKPSPKK